MDIELQPPTGFSGLTLGQPEQETALAAEAFGPVKTSRGAPVEAAGVTFPALSKMIGGTDPKFILTFDQHGNADTVELMRPREPESDVTVTFEGIDVFGTPWSQVLEEMESRGHRIVRDDEDMFFHAPDLTLGFSRDAAHEVPLDDDGEPLYFESVLVAKAGYYDGPGDR
ncbi:hypothetical protein KGQ19_37280 [Catenulispora sp. NL8]|uniref:Uncharacterized protein n=1 Tax=Catenulispora pinistramenti TaxID=2705254 RepID=A0ABS5L2G6_9ACTN|nr:hypothetical protein [Catenulispora pinistramenti]MBS2552523.1 hypothetical protein [Catenulispora pinistramenti]